MLETIHPFAIAFLIGFLIGIERERAHAQGMQALGVRSFTLIGLLGTLAARLDDVVLAAGITTAVLGSVALGYVRSTRPNRRPTDIGLTTELTAVIVYGLGYLAYRERGLAALLGVVALLILVSRAWLHRFVRETLLPKEVAAAVTLLAFLVVVVPFLPDRAVDPWALLNPRRLGLLAGIIAGMQFLGYAASRALGQRRGLMVSGFLGGLVSSTATVTTIADTVRGQPAIARTAAGAAMLATVASLIELLAILLSGAPRLGQRLAPPLLAMIAVGALLGWWLAKRGGRSEMSVGSANPLDVQAVVKLTAALGGLLMLVAIARRALGAHAMELVAFVGGLIELHGISLATAVLHAQGEIGVGEAETGIALAIAASFLSKTGLALGLGRVPAFAARFIAALVAVAASGLLAYWVALHS